jgi:hypothetical protein
MNNATKALAALAFKAGYFTPYYVSGKGWFAKCYAEGFGSVFLAKSKAELVKFLEAAK